MAEKLEDLNLPNSVVFRLVKSALPDNVFVGKEARIALSKAASMFVLYLTSAATNVAQKSNRKTMNPQDVIEALIELEFEDFVSYLKDIQEAYKNSQKKKKESTKGKQKETEDPDADQEVEAEEELELIEDDDDHMEEN